MASRPSASIKLTNTLHVKLSNVITKLSLASLHDAIRRDLYLNVEEILSVEADYYYEACFIKTTSKQAAEKALELSEGTI